jgi:hypothetical protein
MQSTTISIPVPEEFDDPESEFNLVEYFQDLVEADLALALDTDVWEIDDRAQTYETTIDEVEVRGDDIVVNYSVSFEAYYGCRDQNYSGDDQRHITGTRVGPHWVFVRYVQRLPRDTVEEF